MKTALVTGTSTGIGLETTIELARAGYRVYAGMRNVSRDGNLRDALRNSKLDVTILPLDVLSDESLHTALGEIHKACPIDILVNNAGIGGAAPLENTPEAEHRAIFDVNYFGAIRCINAVLPSMRERESGVIVNVTSMEGLVAFPNQIAYSASKYALECAGEALAHEVYAFGIRVVNIEPGVVMTNIFENSKTRTRFDKRSPYVDVMRRNGKMFAAGFRKATPPKQVATTIREAIESSVYRLRWPVGSDAHSMWAGRSRMSDEEWVAMGGRLSDQEYNARFRSYFDIEL